MTCRCLDCGQNFYADEPPEGFSIESGQDDHLVDNEEELNAAEDEIKKDVEDDGDRRCW